MKCEDCNQEIKGKIAYRHGRQLCSQCFESLKNQGRFVYQKYWETWFQRRRDK